MHIRLQIALDDYFFLLSGVFTKQQVHHQQYYCRQRRKENQKPAKKTLKTIFSHFPTEEKRERESERENFAACVIISLNEQKHNAAAVHPPPVKYDSNIEIPDTCKVLKLLDFEWRDLPTSGF